MNPKASFEFLLFLLAASAGVYGFGRAFQGQALWLAVSAVARIVLAKQMGRIQDGWPRRRPMPAPAERKAHR